MDTVDKLCIINPSTLAIKVGNRVSCEKMCDYVIEESSCMVRAPSNCSKFALNFDSKLKIKN